MIPTAPFVKRKSTVPPDAVQRFGPTQVLHMIHYDTPLHGSGQVLQANESLFANNNRCNNDSLCSLKEPGRLSNWKQFVIYGCSWQVFFEQIAAPGVGERTAEELYDLFVYYSRVHVTFQDAEKQILWSDQVPAGGGVYGFSGVAGSFHLTNGNPMAQGFFKFKEPLVITPQKTFQLNLRWMDNVANVGAAPAPFGGTNPLTQFNNAINSNKLGRVSIPGLEGRDWING